MRCAVSPGCCTEPESWAAERRRRLEERHLPPEGDEAAVLLQESDERLLLALGFFDRAVEVDDQERHQSQLWPVQAELFSRTNWMGPGMSAGAGLAQSSQISEPVTLGASGRPAWPARDRGCCRGSPTRVRSSKCRKKSTCSRRNSSSESGVNFSLRKFTRGSKEKLSFSSTAAAKLRREFGGVQGWCRCDGLRERSVMLMVHGVC